jgi:hypothetical protein
LTSYLSRVEGGLAVKVNPEVMSNATGGAS